MRGTQRDTEGGRTAPFEEEKQESDGMTTSPGGRGSHALAVEGSHGGGER